MTIEKLKDNPLFVEEWARLWKSPTAQQVRAALLEANLFIGGCSTLESAALQGRETIGFNSCIKALDALCEQRVPERKIPEPYQHVIKTMKQTTE